MELIKPGVNIDFVGKMKYAMAFSAILIVIGIASVIYHGGFNLGIDFAGGSIIQVKFSKNVSADQIRESLQSTKLANSTIQQFGDNEFLIRTHESFSDQKMLSANVEQPLSAAFQHDYEISPDDFHAPDFIIVMESSRERLFHVRGQHFWIGKKLMCTN